MYKKIIDPIDKDLLIKELSKEKFLRFTNKGGNEIYTFTSKDSPNLMLEVGRLRELSYRSAGGGTGAILDIDSYDTMEFPYRQLIVWNPDQQEIIGGYRYYFGSHIPVNAEVSHYLSSGCYFGFSPHFIKNYLPHAVELGRAFVQPEYQSSVAGSKSLFALDNLWDGLGAIIVNHPEVNYFFGKVTTYRKFNSEARDILLRFLHTYFPDTEKLMTPKQEISTNLNAGHIRNMFLGVNFEDDYRFLGQKLKQLGENIPPMMSAYINLSSSMKTMGTIVNEHFGDVDETAILVTIQDIFPHKLKRYELPYQEYKLQREAASA